MSRIAKLCGLVLLSSMVATPLWADPPTTRPAATVAAPVAFHAAGVFVAPFRPLTDAPQWAWAGPAVQQNLVSDLARASFRPTAAAPDADPLPAARAAGARFLVTGTYQWAEPELRFDGQIRDVTTGSVLGGLSVTADGRDVFGLEDELSTQLLRTLARTVTGTAGRPVGSHGDRPVPPSLQPDALAAAIAPPAAAGTGSAYQGSALQAYVDANRTPSVDYDQQVANVRQASTFGSYNSGGCGYGGYGYDGYGGCDDGYLGGYASGGYLPGVSYPIAGGIGGFGYGGLGYGGFARGGFGGGYAGHVGSGFAGGRGGVR